jgi:hypothetical protein
MLAEANGQHLKTDSCVETVGYPCRACQKKMAATVTRRDFGKAAHATRLTFNAAVISIIWGARAALSSMKLVAAWLGL